MRESPSTMSDHSECGSDDSSGKCDDICRDFLRNVCNRGSRCRYRHPHTYEAKDMGRKNGYTFCHDFQNSGCHRPNCRFLHCSREEEEYFKQTSRLPDRLQNAVSLGIGVAPSELPLLKGEVPVCKDFLKGDCKRGSKCKFRHITVNDYEYQLRKSDHRSNSISDHFDSEFDQFERFEYGQVVKRRRTEYEGTPGLEERFSSAKNLSYQLLEDENQILRRKVEELKKQVSDLTATNEVLLEQNARFRISKASTVQTVNIPVCQALALSHSLTGAAPTQLAITSELASQHAATLQRLTRELAQPVPGTIPSGTGMEHAVSMNPTIVAGTIPQQNLSVGSLAPASVAIQQNLPHLTLPQHLSVSIASSLPQNIMTPSTQLISYPIVSQNMRTSVASSSLAH